MNLTYSPRNINDVNLITALPITIIQYLTKVEPGRKIKKMKIGIIFIATVFATLVGSNALAQNKLETKEIIEALKSRTPVLTRSLSSSSTSDDKLTSEEILLLKDLTTRGLKIENIEKVGKFIDQKKLPSLNIQILFEFDSDKIDERSLEVLDSLGNALLDESMIDTRILLNGHTDSRGNEVYNLQLSQRRSEAIKRYMLSKFRIDAERIIAIGFGEMRLKDIHNPEAETNRRVEVVNIGTAK